MMLQMSLQVVQQGELLSLISTHLCFTVIVLEL